MSRAHYYVVHKQGRWMISFNQKDFGPYPTQASAIRYAVDAAHQSGQKGLDAQVLVQAATNQFRTEWTYGHDPYPPRG